MSQLVKWYAKMDGVTVAFTGFATTVNHPQSAEFNDSFDIADARNSANEVFASCASNRVRTATIEVIPFDSASPGTLAGAKANVKFPEPMTLVTLDNFDNDMDGDWNYAGGGSMTYTNNEEAVRLRLPLRRVGATPAAQAVLS